MLNSEDRTEKLLKDLIQYGMLPPVNMFDKVVRCCFKKKIESIIESDYNQASVYDISLGKLSKLQADNQLGYKMEEIRAKGNIRIEQIQERIKITKQMFEDKIEKLDEECKKRVDEMHVKQDKEIDEFEKKWNSPEYMAHFSKPSYNLLQLRFIERKQAIFKEYIAARKTKMEADKLQEYEEEMAHAQMEQAMNKDYDKLLRRQDDDIRKVEDLYEKQKTVLKRQEEHEIEVLEKAIANIQKRDPNSINKRLHSLKPSLANAMDNYVFTGDENEDMSFLSPRTASKFSIFRDTDPFELNITPPSSERIDEIVNETISKYQSQLQKPQRSQSNLT